MFTITLRLSEPPSYVRYLFPRTELIPRYPTGRMKHLYDVNVHAVFYTAREAAKYMIPHGGGSIVLVASISADVSLILWKTHAPSELYFQIVNTPQVSGSPFSYCWVKLA